MTLRVSGLIFSLLSISIFGCEQKVPSEEPLPAPAATPTEQPQAQPPAGNGDPSAVCSAVIEAAKAQDLDKIVSVSMPGAADALGAEAVKQTVLPALAAGTCGDVKSSAEDTNKATVQLNGAPGVKDLPFIKTSDGWRFDAATYLAKGGAPAAKAVKGKKAAKKGGKKKGKKGK